MLIHLPFKLIAGVKGVLQDGGHGKRAAESHKNFSNVLDSAAIGWWAVTWGNIFHGPKTAKVVSRLSSYASTLPKFHAPGIKAIFVGMSWGLGMGDLPPPRRISVYRFGHGDWNCRFPGT